VKRVLVNNGSSANGLTLNVFNRMNLSWSDLTIVQSPLVGFTRDILNPEGVISLPMTIGGEPCQATIFVSFLVMKMPPTYNVILGHPSQAALKDVVSIPHLKMNFPTLGEGLRRPIGCP
ncbi:hypothetical protein CFOL_v3_13034, partial [Cephalotus follicularis]